MVLILVPRPVSEPGNPDTFTFEDTDKISLKPRIRKAHHETATRPKPRNAKQAAEKKQPQRVKKRTLGSGREKGCLFWSFTVARLIWASGAGRGI